MKITKLKLLISACSLFGIVSIAHSQTTNNDTYYSRILPANAGICSEGTAIRDRACILSMRTQLNVIFDSPNSSALKRAEELTCFDATNFRGSVAGENSLRSTGLHVQLKYNENCSSISFGIEAARELGEGWEPYFGGASFSQERIATWTSDTRPGATVNGCPRFSRPGIEWWLSQAVNHSYGMRFRYGNRIPRYQVAACLEGMVTYNRITRARARQLLGMFDRSAHEPRTARDLAWQRTLSLPYPSEGIDQDLQLQQSPGTVGAEHTLQGNGAE